MGGGGGEVNPSLRSPPGYGPDLCSEKVTDSTPSPSSRDFLGNWKEVYMHGRADICNADKAKLILSKETVQGLHITGWSMHICAAVYLVSLFVELINYFVELPKKENML